jgi:hypothetical protein
MSAPAIWLRLLAALGALACGLLAWVVVIDLLRQVV